MKSHDPTELHQRVNPVQTARCMPFSAASLLVRCALLAILIGLTGCHSVRPFEVPAGPHFSILTYNVNWGAPRPDVAAEIIRESGAEMVCLQETTRSGSDTFGLRCRANIPIWNSATREAGWAADLRSCPKSRWRKWLTLLQTLAGSTAGSWRSIPPRGRSRC
jgi:hypothetical protein